ncbi:transketolase [Robiginitomaculum antarcticum]|uniref:transketolase n=1 Tax=Robiginitomaculum antarcticum TaxID=437507 RepID=UPI000375C453|nr:transketolase [Robiginitomaculum antarcticum]
MSKITHTEMANAIRALSMDAVQAANSGHPGMPMGMADVATVLFDKFLKFDPKRPDWADRDQFILSAGHGSMLIYSLLHLTGYKAVTLEQIKNFRQIGSNTAGHPEYGHTPGVETTTGPLGQGIANAVGFALAERHMNAKYGDDIVDHHTYVIAGDGCLMEGISQEAIALAGHLKLSKLVLFWDDNSITIDGAVELSDSTDQKKRFEACGWKVISVDGHDSRKVAGAIRRAQKSDQPVMIACKTVIGKGSPNKAGTSGAHGAPLGEEEIALTRNELGIEYGAFDVPEDIYKAWKRPGRKGGRARRLWADRLAGHEAADQFEADMSGNLPADWMESLQTYKDSIAKSAPKIATRASSGNVLKVITEAIPTMISGSADLEGSNKTKTPATAIEIQAGEYGGRYINYGIREHAMGAVMNGLSLHGGIIPYSGTFLVFADYARPAIRLSALMGVRVIYVMTHDSIGVGEDGPTHQPVEHVASLRAIPNCYVYRPADALETAECWELAVQRDDSPSIMALTRQGLPAVRDDASRNMCERGGYVLRAGAGKDQIVLVASGSEVHKAVEAHERLAKDGISARVVSMPCMDIFMEQDEKYITSVMGKELPKIAIEAGIRQGWDALIGRRGGFIGMNSFGASGPGDALFEHFGITTDAIVTKAKEMTG